MTFAPLPISQLTNLAERAVEAQTSAQGAAEPYATAVLLALMGVLVAISVLFSRAIERLGVPVVLLFLVLGMLGGSEGFGGIEFDDYSLAVRLGTIALVLILFDGGLNTSVAAVRQVVAPASLLATLGVALTAGLVMLFARLLGLSWAESALLGAVVSSTDAAAVFAVLRGGSLHLRQRVERTIEVESCINDPMAIILTVTIIEVISSGQSLTWRTAMEVPLQLVVGATVGVGVGFLGRLILRRLTIPTVGLIPALTLSLAFVSFGGATLVRGSGFLAVYLTAVTLGGMRTLPYRSGLVRVHDSYAWLAQIGMFLMLGLLVFPSQLLPVAPIGLGIGLFLAVVARPAAVALCLWPFGFSTRETLFIGWAGLRGAVPIILATFPLLAAVEGADHLFNLVFFVMVVSSIIPGTTLRVATRWAGLLMPHRPAPPAVLEINAPTHLEGQLTAFYIDPTAAVAGALLSEIPVPDGSAVVMIVRSGQLMAARGKTRLLAGDHAYVFCRPDDQPIIELLFGSVLGEE